MRAFLLSLVAVIGLATLTGFLLEGFVARDADAVHTLPSVRVGAEGTVDHRDFTAQRMENRHGGGREGATSTAP